MFDFQSFFDWLNQPVIKDRILVGLLMAVLGLILTSLLKKFGSGFWELSMLGFISSRKRIERPGQLDAYRQKLEKKTFHINHSWMKEDQTLEDILVSVFVSERAGDGMENLEAVLRKAFRERDEQAVVPRIVITGAPGSGKSVAMKMVTRSTWRFSRDATQPYIPVLLTFATYRQANFDIEEALTLALQEYQFASQDALISAANFVAEILPKGKLVIILDGLDELKQDDREEAVARLIRLMRTQPEVPVVFSCRTAPYQDFVQKLQAQLSMHIEMADFTPAAMRDFIYKWHFDSNKSSAELWSNLNQRIHLQDLAKNPLMLTIICFLYSQPQHRLPDNRAKFYKVCTQVLLETWDQAKDTSRANHFYRDQKEKLLARLAHAHLSGPNPERDIEEDEALERLGHWMEELFSFSKGKNIALLNEIKNNSGLLVHLPPNGLRFPHQTFLEYYGAAYFLSQRQAEELLDAFHKDPKRWREVVLLYCGLTSNSADTELFLDDALASEDLDLALEILVHASQCRPQVAERVIDAAESTVVDISPEAIESLGILAGNENLNYAERIFTLLKDQLEGAGQKYTQRLQALVVAVMRRPDALTQQYLIDHFDDLNLTQILPSLGERGVVIIERILRSQELPKEKLFQLFQSLRLAGLPNLLYEALCMAKEETVSKRAAYELACMSKSHIFWSFLETPNLLAPPLNNEQEAIWQEWGWPMKLPKNEVGKKIMVLLASSVAENLSEHAEGETLCEALHPLLAHLVQSLDRKGKFWDFKDAPQVDDELNYSYCSYRLMKAGWKRQLPKELSLVFFLIFIITNVSLFVWLFLGLSIIDLGLGLSAKHYIVLLAFPVSVVFSHMLLLKDLRELSTPEYLVCFAAHPGFFAVVIFLCLGKKSLDHDFQIIYLAYLFSFLGLLTFSFFNSDWTLIVPIVIFGLLSLTVINTIKDWTRWLPISGASEKIFENLQKCKEELGQISDEEPYG